MRLWVLVSVAPITLGACAAVLGIEDAELDIAPAGSLCAQYCQAVQANCADNPVYESETVCLAVCAGLPEGAAGDTSGNTVGCRLGFAQQAASSEPQTNCPIAGPGGEGFCGSDCEGFCRLFYHFCGDLFADAFAADLDACEADCADNITNLPDPYSSEIQSGNSLECRLYHVSAATQNAALHCPHTALIPPSPCE